METLPFPSHGLTQAEVDQRLREGSVNRAPNTQWLDYALIIRQNVLTSFNGMVFPAALALLWLRDYQAAIAVSGMGLANTLIGLFQELRAKRHLDRLAILSESRANVIRDGEVKTISASDVVLDDQVLIRAGDALVADGQVLHARFLEIDEALLTGESEPVRRQPQDHVLSGSVCVAGEGLYRAENVGKNAYAQSLATQARQYSSVNSPLTRSINRLVQYLTYVVVFLCLLYVTSAALEGWPDDAEGKRDLIRMIAATITSMVPQGLILTSAVAFTLGAISMGVRGAVVQRLSAVETMAAVDVICTDKTGTLTTNRLRVEQVRPFHVSEEEARSLLTQFARASIDRDNRSIQGIRHAFGEGTATAFSQIPFKSQNRYSAIQLREGEPWLVLGAPEALLPRIDAWEREHSPEIRFRSIFDEQLRDSKNLGVRFLAFGRIERAWSPDSQEANALPEFPIQPLALVGMSDELRPDADRVLEALHAQNIQFKILSGDNPDTVRGTISHLHLPLAKEAVASGKQLDESADPDGMIARTGVFGRVSPAQKVRIVETLQQQGKCVAMIGDGVNDVMPIKKANLGIAMGAGSSASKTVSGLVLETNDFGLLPEVLDQGRIILRSLRRSGKLIITKNVYSLLLILSFYVGWLGIPFPYIPQQVTLLNWSVIGIPSIAITFARERSRHAVRVDFLGEVLGFALRMGVLIGGVGVGLLYLGEWWEYDERAQRTLLCSFLMLSGISNLFRAMDDAVEPATGISRWIPWLSLFAIPFFLLCMYVPVLARFFELVPLTALPWSFVLGAALFVATVSYVSERKRPATPANPGKPIEPTNSEPPPAEKS